MSIAQNWKKRVDNGEAEQPTTKLGKTGSGGRRTTTKAQLFALLDAAVDVARNGLKALRSKTDKVTHKKDKLLPEFAEYVDRLMDKGWEHALLPWYMVWCLDCGAMEKALAVGRYCLERNIAMPEDSFVRPIPTIIADLLFKWAEEQFQDGHSAEPYFSEVYDLVTTSSGTDPWAMPDEVRAKYYKLKGLMEYEAGKLQAAHDNLQKALDLKATVKTVLKEVTKKLEEVESAEAPEETPK